jgi:Tfp pilus assembly protein PilN
MAVPVLKLDLAPPSNFWRTHHLALGWAALALGGVVLAGSLGLTWMAYQEAARSGRLMSHLQGKTGQAGAEYARVLAELRSVDVPKELPRWRLAERIYSERSLPWSRLTAELERSLAQDVRLRSIQRNRGSDRKVQLKIKGEARSREAEADFVQALQKNTFFEQVILEREGERQGGGVEFDYTLIAATNPPPYQPLPKFGPPPRSGARAAAGTPAVQPRGVAVPPPGAPRPAAPAAAPRVQPGTGAALPSAEESPQDRARRNLLYRMNQTGSRPRPINQENAP